MMRATSFSSSHAAHAETAVSRRCALAAGLLEDVPFHYEGAREKLLDFPDGILLCATRP